MTSSDDQYIPDLSKVFEGEATVFSWDRTYQSLKRSRLQKTPANLEVLQSSLKIKGILQDKVPSLPTPTQQSKSAFETKTAAIHATPSATSSYNVTQIKEDALWLAKKYNISEDEALRIVILQWDLEPISTLKAGFSDAEHASLRDVFSENGDATDIDVEQLFPQRGDELFEQESQRRTRQVSIYFREQAGLIATSIELNAIATLPTDSSSDPSDLSQFAKLVNQSVDTHGAVKDILENIEQRLQRIATTTAQIDGDPYLKNLLTISECQNISLLLDLLLLKIRGPMQLSVPKELVLQWFHIAAESSFFSAITSVPSDIVRRLHASAAILSVAFLDAAAAIANISGTAADIDIMSYYLDLDSAAEVTQTLLTAVEASIFQAGPAALIWALLLDGLRAAAATAKETREAHHAQKSIDQGQQGSSPANRRTSLGSLQQSVFEDVMDHVLSRSPVSDLIGYLLRCSTEISRAYDAIAELAGSYEQEAGLVADIKLQILQEAVTVSVSGMGYTPDVLRMQFAVLFAQDSPSANAIALDLREAFIEDDFLMSNIFAVAAGRFPYESVPFLRLCRLLVPAKIFDEHGAHYIAFRLRNLASFTQSAEGAFAAYTTVREDENLNLVTLERDASMIGDTTKALTDGANVSSGALIPADTLGEVISESTPPVIRWQHSYSGLSLLGSWLELHYLGRLQTSIASRESANELVTEIILILNGLISITLDGVDGIAARKQRQILVDEILNESSSRLQNDQDVAVCIFDILEQELQHFRRRPSNTFNTNLLAACIKFATSLIKTRPDQFWTLIGNSSLLQSYSSSDFLYSIIAGVEVPNQSYSVLESSVSLYREMLSAALLASRIASQSSTTTTTTTTPYRSVAPQTQRLQASMLLSMTRTLYAAFDNLAEWTFQSVSQMSLIVKTISDTFSTVMMYSYGVGEVSSKRHVTFRASCNYLMSQLRPATQSGFGALAIVKALVKSAHLFTTLDDLDINPPSLPLSSLLSLGNKFIGLGTILDDSPSLLELQLLDAMPIIIRTLSADESALSKGSELIIGLLPAVESARTVSLLGHLGSTSSLCLLQLLKSQQRFSHSIAVQAMIWRLFVTLVGQKQQWLALVILTGAPPSKESVSSKGTEKQREGLRGRTVMDIAITGLTHINKLPPQTAIAMLEFVIQAQQNWSWTATALKRERELLPALVTYIRDTFADNTAPLTLSYRNKIASLITDLSTTHLHYARVTQEKDIIKTIMSLIFVIAENVSAIKVESYNVSLHANLKRNFAAKFPGLDVTDLRRSKLTVAEYGEMYYYDIAYAEDVLQNDYYWNSSNKKRNQSFAAEFQRANLNLSVTESEIILFRSAKHFLIEHCGYFVQNGAQQNLYPAKAVHEAITTITKNCLKANSDTYPVQQLFENLFQSRLDLSIALLQKLIDVKAKGFEIKGLVHQAWRCACARNSSYEQALANNDLIYWRSTLKVVLLTLQFHCGGVWSTPAAHHDAADMLKRELTDITPVILEIMTVVIGQGFRTVVASIQDQRQSSKQSGEASTVSLHDLSLILSLLNTCLRITRAPEYINEGSNRLISSGIIPACCLLYSWSHTLLEPQHANNPVYADLSLQYLSGLSTLAPVAEEMGTEGVLSRLLTGRTTQTLQSVPEGASHVDQRPHCRYLYGLWASGMLPICLNLLHSMGAPIAAEISVFLNQFPNQLSRASTAFVAAAQSKGRRSISITHEAAREAATLSLISFILDSYRQAGASAAVDPSMIVPLTGYDEHKKALADDIADVISTGLQGRVVINTEDDAELMRQKDGTTTVLEKRILHELKDALVCLRGGDLDDGDDDK